MSKKEGKIKQDKLVKLARAASITGLSISVLGLAASISGLVTSINFSKAKESFLDEVGSSAIYQEYYEEESDKLNFSFDNNEITTDEYTVKLEELKENGKENFIRDKGTEEQKSELEKHDGKIKTVKTVMKVVRYTNIAGLVLALASTSFSMVSLRKKRKELDEEIEQIKRDLNPFEDFESDEVELPSIDNNDLFN